MAYVTKKNTKSSRQNLSSTAKIQINTDLKISKSAHDDLVCMTKAQLNAYNVTRGSMVQRFREIDKELAGHIVPDDEDKRRIKANRLGKGPLTVKENIQFALMQLDEWVTYLLGVYAPESGMYSAITTKDKQPAANSLTVLMNNHSRVFKHYRNMARALLDMGKYNIGGWNVNWKEVVGRAISGSIAGMPQIKLEQMLSMGNQLLAIDPYNILFDPAVSPIDCPTDGQFIATVDLIRGFTLEVLDAQGFYFGSHNIEYNVGWMKYFEPRPVIVHQYIAGGAPTTNWDQIFSNKFGGGQDTEEFDGTQVERVIHHVWLIPSKWGLGTGTKLEIWRLHILQGEYIVRGERLNNVHDKLPFAIGMPNEDGMNLQARTFAEMLLPFQKYASAQLNMQQLANRKKLYGVTIYNRRVVPLLENEALGGGKVPANPVGEDVDLRKSVLQINDAPDVSKTMEDVEHSITLMQKMLPTVQQQQVASLERATKYQAAAYVQASNRRNQKTAKLIDDQALDGARRMQVSNVMQYQKETTVVDDTTGEQVTVDPEQLRQLQIEFAVTDGLKGVDKLGIVDSMQQIINMLLQSPKAGEVDILGLIDYFMELQGDKYDFTQFKYKSPMDALPLDVRNQMFQFFQKLQAEQHNQGNMPQNGQGGGQAGPGQQQALSGPAGIGSNPLKGQ